MSPDSNHWRRRPRGPPQKNARGPKPKAKPSQPNCRAIVSSRMCDVTSRYIVTVYLDVTSHIREETMARQFGWDGFAFGFGPRAFFWGGPRGRRRQWFESGDMKYVILKLLKDKPRHGYEVMKELEERLHGCYSPSPGTVYPTLQWL